MKLPERLEPTIKEIKFILKRFKDSPLSIAGILIVLAFVVIAVFAPLLAPPQVYNPYLIPSDPELGYKIEPSPPSPKHPFGTTRLQLDVYYGCIWGTRWAFQIALEVIIIVVIIGVALGVISGYYGGIIDEIIMRFTDIILAFPGLILSMCLVAVLTRSGWLTIDAVLLSIIIIGWPGYTRLIRGEVLRVKTEDYIEAARASGASDLRIMFRHILPNTIYSLIIVASLDFGGIVLTAAALSFLGLGAPAGFADWGRLIYDSMQFVAGGLKWWWVYTYPGVFIVLFVLGWSLLGDALRDVLDPLYRRK
ncbi:ABC transporter permease [Candidatus Bathyarchaeota archaeon]|nr:ABC transporter permease [Candidatus Bathyarchaeota archaeon]